MDVKTRETVFGIMKLSLVVSLVATMVSFILVNNAKPVILGIWFGSIISLLLFYELALTISKAVKMNTARASRYTSFKYFIRFVIYALILAISVKSNNLNIFGTIFGILSVKLTIYFKNLILTKKSLRKEE